jgi:hypothetical protein
MAFLRCREFEWSYHQTSRESYCCRRTKVKSFYENSHRYPGVGLGIVFCIEQKKRRVQYSEAPSFDKFFTMSPVECAI